MVKFELIAIDYFLNQCKELPSEEKNKIEKRLVLLKENPFRNKSIHSKKFGKVFRVRIEVEKIKKRIIYVVIGRKIVIAGITNRDDDYMDLEKLLEKVIQQLDSYK